MRRITFTLLAVLPLGISAAVPFPTGPVNDYTRWLDRQEQTWVASASAKEPVNLLECYEHPDRKFYIGTKSTLTVKAPVGEVEKVVDNVSDYPTIFFGFEGIKLSGKIDNGFVVHWHRAVPVFFIPDLRYEVVYQNNKLSPTRKVFRFQMKEKIDLLKGLDGMIVLEAIDSKTTLFTQYLFIDGKYGPLETFDPSRPWNEGVRDFSLANLGVKVKAEKPALTHDALRAEIQRVYRPEQVQACIAKRTMHPGLKDLKADLRGVTP